MGVRNNKLIWTPLLYLLLFVNCISVYSYTTYCPLSISEYTKINGVYYIPKGANIVTAPVCYIHYFYHIDCNSVRGSSWRSFTPYFYISVNNAVNIIQKSIIKEIFKGTKQDVVDSVKYAVRDFYTNLSTNLPFYNISFVPSIEKAQKEINYGNLLNDIFIEVNLQSVINYANYFKNKEIKPNVFLNINFINESSALSHLKYIFNISSNYTIDSNIHRGKILINNKDSFILGKDCKELEIKKISNKTYKIKCGNNIIYYNNTSYIIVSFIKSIYWQKSFEWYLDKNLIISKPEIVVNLQSKNTNNIIRGKGKYVFKYPGLYYLSYNGNPRWNNVRVVVVKPALSGEYHTTIYPQNKIEKHLLADLKAAGIGKHLIIFRIGGSYVKKIIIPEKYRIKTYIKLNFNKNALYIYYKIYTPSGTLYKSYPEEYVTSLARCLHKDCSIPYEITYDDGYNFKTISPKLFGKSNITIKWNKLNITIPKQDLYYGQDNIYYIKIKNIGPKTAEDVKIYNLKYNKSCINVQILNNNPKTIDIHDESTFKLKINIKNLHCNPEDYKISFDVYGWNTYKYHKEIQLPISYINIPSNESFIKPTFSVDIIDKNAKNCYIKEDNIESKRVCNKIYVSSKCNFENDPVCVIDSIAENDYVRFHYINKYFLATEIIDPLKITIPKYVQINSDVNPSIEILIKNTADIPINYSIYLYNFTPLVSIKEIYLNGNPITFNKKITINSNELQKIKIVLSPLKTGIKTAYIRIVKYNPIKTYEIPITISVAPTSTKDLNNTKTKVLYTSEATSNSNTPTTTPEIINPYLLLISVLGLVYNRFKKI